jgi:histidine ammonia-lyase
LEPFLVAEAVGSEGLDSGFMILQYTAASLVSDCKTLAHPDSVDSIPSSANKEDHVSMSLNAARHAREIVDNIEWVIAIECLCAAQAIDLWRNKVAAGGGNVTPGRGTGAALEYMRRKIPYVRSDRAMYPEIREVLRMVRSGELVAVARSAAERSSVWSD